MSHSHHICLFWQTWSPQKCGYVRRNADAGHGRNGIDLSQIIVYAVLWTFCFAVTVYALVIGR
jgi:hypothetical protein